jgi:hypothetical protein
MYKRDGIGKQAYLDELGKLMRDLKEMADKIDEIRLPNRHYRDIFDLLDHPDIDAAVRSIGEFAGAARGLPMGIHEDPAIHLLTPHARPFEVAYNAYENWIDRTLEGALQLRSQHSA